MFVWSWCQRGSGGACPYALSNSQQRDGALPMTLLHACLEQLMDQHLSVTQGFALAIAPLVLGM